MPEFLLAVLIAGAFIAMKYQQIRFIFSLFKRSFLREGAPTMPADPYRNNPEAQRDRERWRADAAEQAVDKLENELANVRLERDIALQQHGNSAIRGRVVYGSAFALGALTCFTSMNIVPDITRDLLSERPAAHARIRRSSEDERGLHRHDLRIGFLTMAQHYYPVRSCAPGTCCHRARVRLIAFDEYFLQLDPVSVPLDFFWHRSPELIDALVATSGGEEPPSQPEDGYPSWVEQYALPHSKQQDLPEIAPLAFSISLD